jgi:hypothetical protein
MNNKAQAIEQQNEFDLARFDKQFEKLQGEQKVAGAILKSGSDLSGTGSRILNIMLKKLKLQRNIMDI